MESLRQWEERSWAWNRLFAFPLLSCCFVLTRLLPSSVLWYIWCCLSCSRYYARVRDCLEQSTLNSEVNRWGANELLDFDAPLNTQSHLRSCLLSTTCEKEVCQRQETEADRYCKDDHVIILVQDKVFVVRQVDVGHHFWKRGQVCCVFWTCAFVTGRNEEKIKCCGEKRVPTVFGGLQKFWENDPTFSRPWKPFEKGFGCLLILTSPVLLWGYDVCMCIHAYSYSYYEMVWAAK